MFIGKRLRQARELRGLTQTQLAKKAGVSQGAIAHIEGGFREPSPKLLSSIALHTRLPVSFFAKEATEEFSLGSLLFRAHASMTRRGAVEATRHAELVYEMASFLGSQVDAPLPVLPELPEHPEAAARETRAAWNLPADDPILNLVSTVEQFGLLVLALPVALEGRDAFSLWAGSDRRIPVIALSKDRPGDRLRLSLAHELGHLVMLHHHSNKAGDEREAYGFAAEFLMPETAMRREIQPPVTLSGIVSLKPRWKVSIQALIRRAFDLSIVSERQYRYLFEQLGRKGWRVREPVNLDTPVERPRRVRQMAELVYGKAIDYQKLASDLRFTADYTREVMEGYSQGIPDAEIAKSATNKIIAFRPV